MNQRSWRGCKDWIDYGSPLSTQSDVACKMYDASLAQLYGFYNDPTVGGISGSIKATIEADPEFVMGHVLETSTCMTGTTLLSPTDKTREKIEHISKMASKQTLSENEKKHIQTLRLMADCDIMAAVRIWEDILLDDPLDLLAIRNAFWSFFLTGRYDRSRDLLAGVISAWKPDMPMYGYILGLYAFTLQETNFYRKAESLARKALEMNKNDIWSTHVVAHVMEMEGRPKEGLSILQETENDWNICGLLSCHMYWHLALFNVEKGNFDDALGIFDSQITKRYKESKSVGNLVDAASLLYRLNIEGVKVKEKWDDLQEVCKDKIGERMNTFSDMHILMSCLGAEDKEATMTFMNTFKDTFRSRNYSQRVSQDILAPLSEAFVAYDNGDFARATDITYPLRYDIVQLGGSNAQRDVFNLFLIDSAIKSNVQWHNKLARGLLSERQAFREDSPLTERLMARALNVHVQ